MNEPDAQHNVLVWNKTIAAIFTALPPIARHLSVQRQQVALLEAELALRPGRKVELGHRFQRLRF